MVFVYFRYPTASAWLSKLNIRILAPNALLARPERPEVLGRFRNGVAEEAHDNAAFVPVLRLNVKVNLVSDLLKVLTGYGHGLSQDGKEEERNDGDLQKHDVLASNCSARVSDK